MSFKISELDLVFKVALSASSLKSMFEDLKTAIDAYKDADDDKLLAAQESLKDSDFRETLIALVDKFADSNDQDAITSAINTIADSIGTLIQATSADDTTA